MTPDAHPFASLNRHSRGHEVVFAELVDQRVTGAAALISEASRLYSASATPSIDLIEWTELCAATVRTWVAVAREARAIHRRQP